MKRLLLLLMIVPMISVSQNSDTCWYKHHTARSVLGPSLQLAPEEWIDIIVCAAENNSWRSLDKLINYSAYPCDHIVNFANLLRRGSGEILYDEFGEDSIQEPLSSTEIKQLNRNIEGFSGTSILYISPLISFAGKQYVKIALDNNQIFGNGVLFELDPNRGNFQLIFHPEDQKMLNKFFKKKRNWRFDLYP